MKWFTKWLVYAFQRKDTLMQTSRAGSPIMKKIKQQIYHRQKWKNGLVNTTYHRELFVKLRREIKADISIAYKSFLTNCEASIE